jgi:hypothetical protein
MKLKATVEAAAGVLHEVLVYVAPRTLLKLGLAAGALVWVREHGSSECNAVVAKVGH